MQNLSFVLPDFFRIHACLHAGAYETYMNNVIFVNNFQLGNSKDIVF
jgi:hypothetical protein